MNDHANALPAGYRLNEYEIKSVLGSGGFGITYKAHDHNLDKPVAIKEYLPSDFAVRDGRMMVKSKNSASKDNYAWGLARFLDEARTLARFDHPHINRAHRFFQGHGTAYLVLEYIQGDILSDLLKSKGRFNEAGLRRMLTELLDGLEAVHNAGYIHRDVKPANIIFRRDGSAVLLDFGAARQAIGQRSQTITSILTRGYAPVEQYLDAVDAMGAWSDLYSLGICAYRCLIGGDESVLIDAPSRAHLLRKGEVNKDMRPAAQVGKGNYSVGLLKAIDWAMQVEEGDRPQSVGAMQSALTRRGEAAISMPTVKSTPTVKSKPPLTAATRARIVRWTIGAIGMVVLASTLMVGIVQYQNWQVKKIAEAIRTETESQREADIKAEVERQRNIADANAAKAAAERSRVAAAEAKRIDAAEQKWQRELAVEQAAFRQAHARDASVRHVGVDGFTDLHIAADNGWPALAKWLIDNGADVNAKSKRRNARDTTPLHLAVWGRSTGAAGATDAADVIQVLLANGADVNAKNSGGYTPVDWAKYNTTDALGDLLKQHGGRCNRRCD